MECEKKSSEMKDMEIVFLTLSHFLPPTDRSQNTPSRDSDFVPSLSFDEGEDAPTTGEADDIFFPSTIH